MSDPNLRDIRGRIQEIEQQLLFLRQQLQEEPEALSADVFDALQVSVDGNVYLLQAASVREVVLAPWCQPLPQAPAWVKGTFSYGKELVPLIDLRHRLLGSPTEIELSHLVVVIEEPTVAGFLVDQVFDVISVDPAQLVEPSEDISYAPFLTGSMNDEHGVTRHLLSASRLSREFLRDAE